MVSKKHHLAQKPNQHKIMIFNLIQQAYIVLDFSNKMVENFGWFMPRVSGFTPHSKLSPWLCASLEPQTGHGLII